MAKSKFVTYECPHCQRTTRLEVLTSDSDVHTHNGKHWYRCTRCKHSVSLDPKSIEEAKKSLKASISKESCTIYSNEKSYTIGEAIYHSEWDDVGKVIRKEKTSSGIQTIVVAFERVGEKRLIENMPIEIEEENSVQN